MANTGRLQWDVDGQRFYETGVDNTVLYPMTGAGTYGDGVAWNGVTAIAEKPSGAEATALYADNVQYLNLIASEKFAASIEAYQSPEEFDACDGTVAIATGVTIGQQTRKKFGLAYRTRIGNDIDADDYGYKLHLVYNCTAAPSERSHGTVNETPEAATLSWEVSTTPVKVENYKPTAHVTIDSTKVDTSKLSAFEDLIYGKDASGETPAVAAKLPSISEVAEFFAAG